MADRDVLINENTMIAIANAIRNKSNSQTAYTPAQMPAAINQISGGSGGGSAITVTDTVDSHGGIIKTINAVDISDTTATAGDVASGKYFYTANGVKTLGNVSNNSSNNLTPYSVGNIHALIFNSAYFTTDYYDTMQNLYAIMVKANTSVTYEHFFGMTADNVRTDAQRSGSSAGITTYAQGTSVGAGNINTIYPISFVINCLDKSELMATLPLTIGAGYHNGALENIRSNMTFYGLNIINSNGNYVARFMPWLDSNSVPCIKEIILGNLYYPTAGTVGYIDNNGIIYNGQS